MQYKLNLLLFFVFLISCNKNEKNQSYNWTDISIKNSYEEIIIYKHLDTASYIKPIYEYKKDNLFVEELVNVERKQIIFSDSEKDSISYYVQRIISNPIQVDRFCTDYVGNLKLKISNSNSTFTVNYESVCRVNTISDDTKKLYEILNKKIDFRDN